MGKIAGGKIGKNYKQTAESGGGVFVKTVPVDDSIMVRFIDEPEEWFGYYEHYDAVRKYFPCVEGGCPGCADSENRRSFRYLANIVLLDEKRVVPLKLTKDLANQLFARYEKYNTLRDREYELSRTGSGMKDTNYMAAPEPVSKFNYGPYEAMDLEKVLSDMLDRAESADAVEEDEDEKPAPKKTIKPKAKPQVEDNEEDEDEVDVDAEVAPNAVTRDDLEEMSLKELRTLARDASVDPKGLSSDALISAILGETDPAADDDEDDDDDTDDVEDVEDVEEDTDEDDDDADEDVEELTEDDLKAMSDTELRALCKEMGVKVGPRSSAKSMIASLLDE